MTSKRRPARKPASQSFRDDVALRVMSACVVDHSRMMASGQVPLQDSERAAEFIAAFSYLMADSMIAARGRR